MTDKTIDRKTFWLGILVVVAVVLLAAHALQPTSLLPTAQAQEAVDHRDYSMATATAASGGEVLYILDKRTGNLGLIVWDSQARRPVIRDVKPLTGVFGGR